MPNLKQYTRFWMAMAGLAGCSLRFWLCQQKILAKPLLYLSYYFKQNRNEYYQRLMAVRLEGDWEGWIKFFLKGVSTVQMKRLILQRLFFP